MSSAPSYDPVPAIVERDATGDIAVLFEDIRETLGVPVVNLIWRHLATMPGALHWAWAALKPLYENNLIAGEANALGAGVDASPHVRQALDVPALNAAGLSGADLDQIRTILRSYERSNAMNIVAVDTLRSYLIGGGAQGDALVPQPDAARRAPIDGTLPKVLSPDDMDANTRALVAALNRFGGRQDVLPTMYRHLAHWPAFLALLHALLAPDHASGQLEDRINRVLDDSRIRAERLCAAMPPPGSDLPPAVRDDVLSALTTFAEGPLCKMIAIVSLIRTAMPKS